MMKHLSLTILGCGSSSGTPVIGCTCPTCTNNNPKNIRTRCSAWLKIDNQSWIIDTGTDFRQQALRETIDHIDGVLYTNPHADHLDGIDDLRAFCYHQKAIIPIYGSETTLDNIQSRFGYAFLPPSGHWERPVLAANSLNALPNINGIPLLHFQTPHGRWETTAYRIGNIAWLTDLNDLTDHQISLLQGLDFLFIDCLGEHPYPSHLSFDQACTFAERIGAKQTYLIHMFHHLEYSSLANRCPSHIHPAYDGLTINNKYQVNN